MYIDINIYEYSKAEYFYGNMVKKIIELGDWVCLGVEPAATVDRGGKEYKQLPRGPPSYTPSFTYSPTPSFT